METKISRKDKIAISWIRLGIVLLTVLFQLVTICIDDNSAYLFTFVLLCGYLLDVIEDSDVGIHILIKVFNRICITSTALGILSCIVHIGFLFLFSDLELAQKYQVLLQNELDVVIFLIALSLAFMILYFLVKVIRTIKVNQNT